MPNLSRAEAEARAASDLAQRATSDVPVAIGGEPLESESYWVFFYDTVEYWTTGNDLLALAGNQPIVVPKNGGPISYLSTALDPEDQLRDLQAAGESRTTS